MITIESVQADYIVFGYESIDRIVLNGYIPTLQTKGAVARFSRKVCHKPILSPVLLKQMTDQFVEAMRRSEFKRSARYASIACA